MSHALAPADSSHYYQRLAELSTLPFWQREEFTEPAGPSAGTSGTGMTSTPSSPGPVSSPPTRPADCPIHDAFGLFQAEEQE
jgi:hypothetical protein